MKICIVVDFIPNVIKNEGCNVYISSNGISMFAELFHRYVWISKQHFLSFFHWRRIFFFLLLHTKCRRVRLYCFVVVAMWAANILVSLVKCIRDYKIEYTIAHHSSCSQCSVWTYVGLIFWINTWSNEWINKKTRLSNHSRFYCYSICVLNHANWTSILTNTRLTSCEKVLSDIHILQIWIWKTEVVVMRFK